jgi:hypothetical protein
MTWSKPTVGPKPLPDPSSTSGLPPTARSDGFGCGSPASSTREARTDGPSDGGAASVAIDKIPRTRDENMGDTRSRREFLAFRATGGPFASGKRLALIAAGRRSGLPTQFVSRRPGAGTV